MIKTILVALDGSQLSWKALEFACDIARKYGAKLVMLHAYHSTSDLRGSEVFDQMVAKRKRAGEEVLNEAHQRLASDPLEFEDDLLEGPAADAIVSAAEVRKVDLVVMGTRGMGSLKGMIFGSVSTKVTHYAPCPVLVVR